jgi:hypothetical protein
MATLNPPQFLEWFEPDELDECPACGERHGLTVHRARSFICFGCGYVRSPEGETTVAALQNR